MSWTIQSIDPIRDA